MNQELTIKIVVENPPGGVDFGLQKGSGSKYETIQIQRSGDKNLEFEFPITVRLNKDGLPNFLGAFVQGPPDQRFVYIDIGTYADQKDTGWSRRLKIPLTGISLNTIKILAMMVASVLKYQRSSTKRVSSPLIVYINPT